MSEINVSAALLANSEDFAGSRFGICDETAKEAWKNALKFAKTNPLVTGENRVEIRTHVLNYGVWDHDGVLALSDRELSALIWQETALSIQEIEECYDGDIARYEAAIAAGEAEGRLALTEDSAWLCLAC